MQFDLERRTAALSVGEFADFSLGPRDAVGGPQGLWRAQLGTHWHNELQSRATADHGPDATFELPITGRVVHRGWTLTLTGRIDQIIRRGPAVTLREIKTVTRALPADETELRRDYPGYLAQLATYAALTRLGLTQPSRHVIRDESPPAPGSPRRELRDEIGTSNVPVPAPTGRATSTPPAKFARNVIRDEPAAAPPEILRAELVFVEVDSGLAQTVTLTSADDFYFRTQLERVAEFLDLRLRARERLRNLRYRPAFAVPRPGQEMTQVELTALFQQHPLVLFEAPTGFGKTGVLLEFALGQLRSGHFDRVLYLTSKSTGQLQVVRTLSAMTVAAVEPAQDLTSKVKGSEIPNPVPPKFSVTPAPPVAAPAVTAWQVRAKTEHCVNTTFHCVRDSCSYLDGAAERWPQSGLARFYLDERQARDVETLRAAGRHAKICPYEITRAALAFNDVWIGDYNYVFAPRNRGLFFEQPGFAAARTLLLVDEAHNLPSRVADAYSHAITYEETLATRSELNRIRPPAALVTAWDHWCHGLQHLHRCDALSAAEEDDLRHLLETLAKLIPTLSLDLAALGPDVADTLWKIPSLWEDLSSTELPRLWWCPRDGELALTCLDAASAIGATLREFGGVVLASATLTPVDGFTATCGLDDSTARSPQTVLPEVRSIGELPLPANSDRTPAVDPTAKLGTLNKRETKKLLRQLTSAAELLRVEEVRAAAQPALLRAHTPWRDGAYVIGIDTRVDTTFQHRSHHYTTTAATIAALHAAAQSASAQHSTLNSQPSTLNQLSAQPSALNPPNSQLSTLNPPTPQPSTLNQSPPSALNSSSGTSPSSIAIFFPSYAYAEAIARELASIAPSVPVSLQPKLRDLAAQATWVENSLRQGGAMFLVLGSSFAESIDLLGGRVSHAMVVGPALPEVNAVQRARLAEATRQGLGREAAFRRVYQAPGMTKVNQALGRLVRSPGQRARVLLHCRRFLDSSYAELLASEYRGGTPIATDEALESWLRG